MVSEGVMALLPATISESPCSDGSKNYIRNVEAVGSNPITSTGPKSLVGAVFQRGALRWIRRGQGFRL